MPNPPEPSPTEDSDGNGSTWDIPIDELMSVVAHDLRNPIAVVRASAQMAARQLARGDTDASQRRIESIVQQADRLSEMLERFLDATRAGTGQLALRRERVALAGIVSRAIERARATAGDAAARLVEVDVPEAIVGTWDPARLQRAVRALLENAYAYGEPSAPVRVWCRADDAHVRLFVSGGGPGPLPDEANRLFQPFFRGRAAADAGQAGSGLGLFIARGIARAHGGDVRRSDDGPPDTFQIEMPLDTSP